MREQHKASTAEQLPPRNTIDSATIFLRSRKSLPLRIVLLALWIVAFAFGGMAQGKISTVAESDPAFFYQNRLNLR